MTRDIQDTVRDLLVNAIENTGKGATGAKNRDKESSGGGGLSGLRGVAAGVGAAALAPLAVKGAGKLAQGGGLAGVQGAMKSPVKAAQGLVSDAGGELGSKLGDTLSEKVDEAGGPVGMIKDALPFGGGGGGAKGGGLGVGRGRRMPVQQSVDIGAPLETVYNQWSQFEDWPNFMHRVKRVSQEEETTVGFAVKIWGKTKEFTAEIDTQRPDERIKWHVTQGMTHAGLVTFHELGPSLTRVLLSLDVDPGGMLEKAARGMRHVKRAARGDLHRFKAFIEMQEQETGAWRGVIEDGEVVEEHDPAYDEGREYSDPHAFDEDSDEDSAEDETEQDSEDEQDGEDEQDSQDEPEEEDEQPRSKSSRRQRRPSSNGHAADEKEKPASTERGGGGDSSSRRSSSRGRSSGSGTSRGRSGSGAGSGSSRRTRSRGASS